MFKSAQGLYEDPAYRGWAISILYLPPPAASVSLPPASVSLPPLLSVPPITVPLLPPPPP